MTDFTDLVDLAAARLGGSVTDANDEFFAAKDNLVKDTPAEWREGVYTERGKWMDGWETRRRREPGYDWAIVRLGVRGIVRGVVVDTAFFRGNFPESCSIEARDGGGEWKEILPKSLLQGDSKNPFAIAYAQPVTHLRLNIFPDGGVARLRVHGEPTPDWSKLAKRGEVDLAAVENGGRVIEASDMFFGHRHNLIMPGRGVNMGDGWETKRRRGPGNDWVVVKLGHKGTIERVVIDTIHFKGNAPGSCKLEAGDGDTWSEILPMSKLQPDSLHEFEIAPGAEYTHVRLSIYPDGGVSRMRVFGRVRG